MVLLDHNPSTQDAGAKFSASLVNRARLSLKRNKAHMYVKMLGRRWRVHNIWASRYHVWCYKKKTYQYRMTLQVSTSFQSALYSHTFKIQFWSTQNVYFSLNEQNIFCLGTVYIQIHLIYDFAFVFNLAFFRQYSLCNPAILCLILPSTGITGITLYPALRYIFL